MTPTVRRWVLVTLSALIALSVVPFACIAKARNTRSPGTAWHVFPDMDSQKKFKAQSPNPLFQDGRAMRRPVAGTVARGELFEDSHKYRGVVGESWAETFPMPLSDAVLARGRERFGVYCSPCHGLSGYGDGIVAKRAEALGEGTWVPPSSFHTDLVRSRPVGHLFNTASNGIRNMAGYGSQITVDDRWAIVAYIRALQRSQNARPEDVPAEFRGEVR